MIRPAIGLASVVAVVLVLRHRFVSVLVEGDSMAPTLRAGQRVLVRRTRAAHRGQVIVLASPLGTGSPPWLIKRVAAAPGDPVPRDTVPALRDASERWVPTDQLVLLGDNPAASYDSRRAGYFTAGTVLGVVVRVPRGR
jgi:signal peptidase I